MYMWCQKKRNPSTTGKVLRSLTRSACSKQSSGSLGPSHAQLGQVVFGDEVVLPGETFEDHGIEDEGRLMVNITPGSTLGEIIDEVYLLNIECFEFPRECVRVQV